MRYLRAASARRKLLRVKPGHFCLTQAFYYQTLGKIKGRKTAQHPLYHHWHADFFDILIQSTTPQQPPGFPWWTEPQVRLIYWGFFIIIMNLFWPFSSIFYEEVRHGIGIFIRGEFIQSLRINLLRQIHFTDPASAAWSSRNFISW